ncbi:hypothetical protein ANN_04719 [Periplaneta americana]|uniref:PHD-type domain-containing protein n=1 Tax=Periplaneta americana TaxID=6978 RepID=A0ABQ8T964_PERAM|nr:hypothetical protein ANN_04719 [Periplaneta americana]
MMLKLIRKRKRNWLGHFLRRNCLLKDALEGMVNRRRVRGRRRYDRQIKIYGSYEETKRKTGNRKDWRMLGLHVFLRDCKECVCVVACGQFRTRDCRKMDIFLCCVTQPIIEASSSIHFGCYQLFYNELEGKSSIILPVLYIYLHIACEKKVDSEKRYQVLQHINTCKHKELVLKKPAQEAVSNNELEGLLVFISAHFHSIPKTMKTLEVIGIPLQKTVADFDRTMPSLTSVPGIVGEKVKEKVSNVLSKNPGYDQLNEIREVLEGKAFTKPTKFSIKQLTAFVHAAATSCDVERSFSRYNAMLRNNRPTDFVVISEHFQQAGLSVFNNNWSSIHDFTPIEGENNWCLFPDTIRIQDYVSLPAAQELQRLNISLLEEKSVVPYTWGPHKTPTGESCLVTFFSDGQQVQRAKAFINSLKIENPDCLLLLSKETQMQPSDAERVFKTNSYNIVVQRGMVVGLQYSGPNCIQSCQKARECGTDTTQLCDSDLAMLLVIGGVELNPGPVEPVKCGICRNNLRTGLLCSICSKWFHFSCQKRKRDQHIEKNWRCKECMRDIVVTTDTEIELLKKEVAELKGKLQQMEERLREMEAENRRLCEERHGEASKEKQILLIGDSVVRHVGQENDLEVVCYPGI